MLLLLNFALADALWTPDEQCPTGAGWNVSHAYSYCGPTTCDACDSTCKEVGLCLVDRDMSCNSGRLENEEPCTFTASVATGECDDDSDCAEGTCVVADRCVPTLMDGLESMAEDVGETTGCGCSSTLAPSWLGALLLLGAGLLRRR